MCRAVRQRVGCEREVGKEDPTDRKAAIPFRSVFLLPVKIL